MNLTINNNSSLVTSHGEERLVAGFGKEMETPIEPKTRYLIFIKILFLVRSLK